LQVLRNSIREACALLRNAQVVFATYEHSENRAIHLFHQLLQQLRLESGVTLASHRAKKVFRVMAG
jgi:hypothetical protein